MSVRTIGVEERRARLARRHRLAPSARVDDDVAAIARDLVVLHASDPSTVVLSAIARMAAPDPAAVERALYDERRLLRMLGMRRTLFTVPVELAPVVQASSTAAVAANERRKLEQLLETAAHASPAGPWLSRLEHKVVARVRELGEATAAELTKSVPDLGRKVVLDPGGKYETAVNLTSRVLLLLGADGEVVRGRPTGRWNTSTHRWSTTADWLGAPIEPLDVATAKVDLSRRWLARFGPATVADLKWWTGWTLGATRAALAEIDTADVDLDGEPGLVLADDVEPVGAPEPWVALLPGLDPTAMGWAGRDWYLSPEHKAQVVDRSGNIGATIWVDGRIVGGWAMHKDGRVVTWLLEAVGKARSNEVTAAAERLAASVGEVRVVPRFPAPLDKTLSG